MKKFVVLSFHDRIKNKESRDIILFENGNGFLPVYSTREEAENCANGAEIIEIEIPISVDKKFVN